jgi:predicted GNAT family acetyltransferase
MANITLQKATTHDAQMIHSMQLKSFAHLLEKYQDYDTNPGNEKIDKVVSILNQKETDYLLIKMENSIVGAIRIDMRKSDVYRISPIFILPEYQNKGIAQIVFSKIEQLYTQRDKWVPNTIREEAGNCHLYEKVGYKRTGKIEQVKDNMHLVYYEKK